MWPPTHVVCGAGARIRGHRLVSRRSWAIGRCGRGQRRRLMAQVRVIVDGVEYVDEVEPRMLLVYYLRERLGKTGTVVGCDTSNCGACTVHLDGQSVKSCSVLAV